MLALHDQTVLGGAKNGFLKSVRKGPSNVKVNDHEIAISDETAKALSRVLKAIMSSRS